VKLVPAAVKRSPPGQSTSAGGGRFILEDY
jgi:hypothetical protein